MLGEVFVIYREWKDNNGLLNKEWTREDKILHRESGPARIRYFPDGLICLEQFLVNGFLHRESGPAYIRYNTDGSIDSEEFCIDGKLHRESGPAYIRYNTDGSIDLEEFHIAGEFLGIDNEGFWKLWERLDERQRQAPNILKYLARYS
jgi:hypothetical protein